MPACPLNPHLSLNGAWRLRDLTRPDAADVPATLPGDNYSALLAAGLIPDPYYRRNEDEVQGWAEDDWEYSREFTVDAAMLAMPEVTLTLTMVDTFATFYLNGAEVGRTRNMFARYRFPVKRFLRPGINSRAWSSTRPCAAPTKKPRSSPASSPAPATTATPT
ncbi:MAG: hypothetical protein J6333_03125 [Planctomycetes bacterium]|nr:hypothetical protein [Planctomycetota bacterium]